MLSFSLYCLFIMALMSDVSISKLMNKYGKLNLDVNEIGHAIHDCFGDRDLKNSDTEFDESISSNPESDEESFWSSTKKSNECLSKSVNMPFLSDYLLSVDIPPVSSSLQSMDIPSVSNPLQSIDISSGSSLLQAVSRIVIVATVTETIKPKKSLFSELLVNKDDVGKQG